MKKTVSIALIISFLLSFSSCGSIDLGGGNSGHIGGIAGGAVGGGSGNGGGGEICEHIYGEWQTDAEGHKKVCTKCGEESESGEHISVEDKGFAPTCGDEGKTDGSHCSVCSAVLEEQDTIPATGAHRYVSVGLRNPTLNDDGFASGEECEVCHDVQNAEQVVPAFKKSCGNFAYLALANKPKGSEMQDFYEALYAECLDYHGSAERDARLSEGGLVAVKVKYEGYGIGSQDAFDALEALAVDCPLFYWISGAAQTDGVYLEVYTNPEYADGDIRDGYNEKIYEALLSSITVGGTTYDKVLQLHDMLIDEMYYAYESDGVTPEDAPWAHNIIGYFINGGGVCESYVDTCVLYLNYWGIENAMATGLAGGENHGWNLVHLEDGEWYWLDITWDDQPSSATGRIYDYFCRTDADFKIYERIIDTELYTLPARAEYDYSGEALTVGTTFVGGDYTYEVIGYREVELTRFEGSGRANIPSHISYNDEVFEVISIGCLEDGSLGIVFASGTTAVSIPYTVKFIRGNALSTRSLTEVTVSSENPYLMVEGKAIYKKDPCVLVCYLVSAAESSFTLKEGTVGIESFAFLHNTALQTIVIPNGLEFISDYAISGCSSLSKIEFGGSELEWANISIGDYAIPNCEIEFKE